MSCNLYFLRDLLTFIFGTEFTGTEFTGTKFTGNEFLRKLCELFEHVLNVQVQTLLHLNTFYNNVYKHILNNVYKHMRFYKLFKLLK